MAIVSLVLGIVGIVLTALTGTFFGENYEALLSSGWIIPLIGLIFCIVGIVLGAKARKNPSQKKGLATAGMVVSIVGTVYCAYQVIAFIACSAAISSIASQLQ